MSKKGVKFDTTRANFNLPTNLYDKVKLYAADRGLPITQAVIMLLYQGLDAKDTLTQLGKFINIYNKETAKQVSSK